MGPSGTCRGWQSSVWMVGSIEVLDPDGGKLLPTYCSHYSLSDQLSFVFWLTIQHVVLLKKVYFHSARLSSFDKLHLKNTLTGHFCTISTLTCTDACQWIFPTFPPCFITLIDHSLSGQSVRSHAQSTLQLKVPRHILTYMSKLYPSDGWVTTHRRWFGIWQCGLYVVKAQSLLHNSIEWVQNSCFHSSILFAPVQPLAFLFFQQPLFLAPAM